MTAESYRVSSAGSPVGTSEWQSLPNRYHMLRFFSLRDLHFFAVNELSHALLYQSTSTLSVEMCNDEHHPTFQLLSGGSRHAQDLDRDIASSRSFVRLPIWASTIVRSGSRARSLDLSARGPHPHRREKYGCLNRATRVSVLKELPRTAITNRISASSRATFPTCRKARFSWKPLTCRPDPSTGRIWVTSSIFPTSN